MTWNAQTTFAVDLSHTSAGAPVAGVDFDQLAVAGDIDLGGATLTGTFGTGIKLGDMFTIITFTGNHDPADKFAANAQDQVFIDGQKFQIHYDDAAKTITVPGKTSSNEGGKPASPSAVAFPDSFASVNSDPSAASPPPRKN